MGVDTRRAEKIILKDFHSGHSGILRVKALMKSYSFWSNKYKEIEAEVL